MRLRLGTRGSALAVAQSGTVAEGLRRIGHDVEMITVKTTGDHLSEQQAPIEGKGIFTKELDEALLARRIDLAVHSLKDLPTELPPGIDLIAVPPREDARDALVTQAGWRLAELPAGARVGTGSLRRRAQLLAMRPDLVVVDARGNIDTRVRYLREGKWDAIVLARAGMRRLGRDNEIAEVFPSDEMIPAVGQGALAVTGRREDALIRGNVAPLEERVARLAVLCERKLLKDLEGGCRVPIAGHARVVGTQITAVAAVFSLDGTRLIRDEETGPADRPEEVGAKLAARLLAAGAAELLREARTMV
jgi:hydroxymethylbilane synthase